MKTINSIYRTFIITALLLLFMAASAQAQITFVDDVNDEAPAAPIDGLLGIGIAAGAYIGLRKKYKSQE